MSTTPVIAPDAGSVREPRAAAAAPPWEFTPEQNVVLLRLVNRMRLVGAALMAIALLLEIWAVLGTGGMLALQAGIALGLTGWWSIRGGGELARAAKTRGGDSRHLMRALHEIGKLYELQYWILLVTALLFAATLVVSISGARWIPEAW